MPGCLYIIATPIGNLEDISLRALRILKEVSLIACEDTRETIKLLNHYHIQKPLISYHEYNERQRAFEIVQKVKEGENIALVSDAGMPGISDPGFHVMTQAIEAQIPLTVIPGPSSLLNALILSGLPTHHFTFEGFIPEKDLARKKYFLQLKEEERTLIFFESSKRLKDSLQNMLEILGDRKIAITRELTKNFETVYRDSLGKILSSFDTIVLKGEFVIVVSGNTSEKLKPSISIEEQIEETMQMMKISRQEAIKLVAHLRGVPKSKVYKESLRNKE